MPAPSKNLRQTSVFQMAAPKKQGSLRSLKRLRAYSDSRFALKFQNCVHVWLYHDIKQAANRNNVTKIILATENKAKSDTENVDWQEIHVDQP
jgi:hypothetical protein